MTTEAQREWQERIETLRNDARIRQQGSTFSQFAQAEADIDRGRFTANERSVAVGSTPSAASQYPAGSTWCAGDQGLELPLNYSVDELQPTGEHFEIAASLDKLQAPQHELGSES